ncbi:E3 ubiquitin-protein ligase rnf213-alpha-like [Gouania willdenowi]|uniref:E3 ubiquitin-protein ligase rnf213-alpha-like n=1 Tax=Gouania willdenowi TaxID=441366 RepID=UPI001055FFAF|nr:E3 ubiquitin-protein ligase rnf213-alpha-like [Gouania willdenowi]
MLCPKCRFPVKHSYNYCPGCGFDLSTLTRDRYPDGRPSVKEDQDEQKKSYRPTPPDDFTPDDASGGNKPGCEVTPKSDLGTQSRGPSDLCSDNGSDVVPALADKSSSIVSSSMANSSSEPTKQEHMATKQGDAKTNRSKTVDDHENYTKYKLHNISKQSEGENHNSDNDTEISANQDLTMEESTKNNQASSHCTLLTNPQVTGIHKEEEKPPGTAPDRKTEQNPQSENSVMSKPTCSGPSSDTVKEQLIKSTDEEQSKSMDEKTDIIVPSPQSQAHLPSQSDLESKDQVLANSFEAQTPQNWTDENYLPVYFHAVISKDFKLNPDVDIVVLKSEAIFGDWGTNHKMVPTPLGDKAYLLETRITIHQNKMSEDLPYKYAVLKRKEKYYEIIFETIYQEKKDPYINRSLRVNKQLLTNEGAWHQYDDMIHPQLQNRFWNSAKNKVLKGRDQAGHVMLETIFDLLTIWNEQNVANFFIQVQQFYNTYCSPWLHDGKSRSWGLPYGEKEVKDLLKHFLNEIIKPEGSRVVHECLHRGLIILLIYKKYLNDIPKHQLSTLCHLLCLPNKPRHHFTDFWKNFASPLHDKYGIAQDVEMLHHEACRNKIPTWILVIPLVHLLRGDSKLDEPLSLVLNPSYHIWTALRSKTTHFHYRDTRSLLKIMKEHAYLANIDRLLVRSWMSLLDVDDLLSFIDSVSVELPDILQKLQFSIKSVTDHSKYDQSLKDLTSELLRREKQHRTCFEEEKGEFCFRTAVKLLGSVCQNINDQDRVDVPLILLELTCLIEKSFHQTNSEKRERIQEEAFSEILEKMQEWRRKTLKSKLLTEWDTAEFASLKEIEVWTKILSMSFISDDHTSRWQSTFIKDFEGKLKKEQPVKQIGIYCKKMEDMQMKSPKLCSAMEKCALEAVEQICQDKSGQALSALLQKHDITKFGNLTSVVVLKLWPTNAKGSYTDSEDLIFQFLLNLPKATTVLQMAGAKHGLTSNLSDEAQNIMTLAFSTLKAVSRKFFDGSIQLKTLKQIFQRKQEFMDFLKIDDLCDDDRCRDIRHLLDVRKREIEALNEEKELVKSVLRICKTLPVKVDFQGLDKKLQQNFEEMNLNECINVHNLDSLSTFTPVEISYFNLSDTTRQTSKELLPIKDSFIFQKCLKRQIEDLSKDQPGEADLENSDGNEKVYTLDWVCCKIFRSCYTQYQTLYEGLKSGEIVLEEVDSTFMVYKGEYHELQKEIKVMCRINPNDDTRWISQRINQIKQYWEIHLALDSSKIIEGIKNILCPKGDFTVLKNILQMNKAVLKKRCLNLIDDAFIDAKQFLDDVTEDHKKCLLALHENEKFVHWVKKELKNMTEMKVFVDLATISAGENKLNQDRVTYFHDAVMGYSSMLYELQEDSDFEKFKKMLSKLWEALKNDEKISTKLRDTARLLDWFNTIKTNHGSVELSSISLATSINEGGVYIIRASNNKRADVETSLTLQTQKECESERNVFTYEDLKELQNKLMLMSGNKQQIQTEVESFTEVFECVQRLAKAFVDLHTAGNPLFRCWEAKIYCKTQSNPCITMTVSLGKIQHCIHCNGSLIEQLTSLSKKIELFLSQWQTFMHNQRSEQYHLNYFTAEQLYYLCSKLTPTNVNEEIEAKVLTLLSFLKPNCTASDVSNAWGVLRKKLVNMGSEDSDSSLVTSSRFPHSETTKEPDKDDHFKELDELWNGYMGNEERLFNDILDIQSLGSLLQIVSVSKSPDEKETEAPELLETKENSLRRSLPKDFSLNQPNLIICPHDQVLTSSICLYMNDEDKPLPSYDEVLLCTPSTSFEQVDLLLRRCFTPGGIGQKIYTLLWADKLPYDVCCAMERSFQKLHTQFNKEYRLVIFCSSEKEHTYIPTAFSQFKRNSVPQETLQRIQKYLSRHYTVTPDHMNTGFKGEHTVGIVASHRAGDGKSLYVQRLYDKLEKTGKQGTAFKKCIRLTEKDIDDHKVLQCLYDTPTEKDLMVFHFDVTSSVQKGLNEFLYKLLFLRYLMDSDGQTWHCSHKHFYIIELLESTNNQTGNALRSGGMDNFALPDIFPKVICRPPKEVMSIQRMEKDDPLMDDDCFRSEAYQRSYQYLLRFHNNVNLDNFTYNGVEGTHDECLQMLLIYCGVLDPSWAELHNFVCFLNVQLKDCENSVFVKKEFVEETLPGFKHFVIKFMILMSKDFATSSLCISDQSNGEQQMDLDKLNEKDLAPFLIRKRWESKPHPYIFFNQDHHSMTFIGFHVKQTKKPNGVKEIDLINSLTGEVIESNIMTKELYNGLVSYKVPFNVNFDQLPRAVKFEQLCNVLGLTGPSDPDNTFELTTDSILKMLAIHMRFRCGIPVIIMGETGCGKTRLIKFMCELKKSGVPTKNMKLVKVHGGTTSEMIYQKVRETETLAKTNTEKHGLDTVIFFDEANTTEAISSIKEIICDNSVQGQQLNPQTRLQIIAACNPYRKHTAEIIGRLEESGLGYLIQAQQTEDRIGTIPLRQLVYRVHKLPPSMMPLVWDFGQLNDSTEQMYITQIVRKKIEANSIENHYTPTITQVLSSSQKFMRQRKDECSFVSLRDVERCMQAFVWFHKNHHIFAKELQSHLASQERVIWSLIMATSVCYQACLESKKQYQETISKVLPCDYTPEKMQQELQLMEELLLKGLPLGKTIARNEALKENFFMMVICIELRIPLFIVGKPGSSKSLSKILVSEAMQGPTSHSELFKRLKQIHLVSFQCSPHSTPEGIINTFRQCARFQENKNLDEYISVVVLDEIGLAEDSPKMPLKALHPLLEEGSVEDEPKNHERVGFIGISNWALDPAKMNRGIFVSRGDLDEKELIKSAEGICSSEEIVFQKIKHLFEPLARAYITVCKEAKGFFGLRDFYSLVKMIFAITKYSKEHPTAEQITGAVLRNFSGKDDMDVIDIFSKELTDYFANATITTIDMVKQSICPVSQMEDSRYLLILTKNYAGLQILQQIFSSQQIHPEIIFGSGFPKDQQYTQICRNINRIKVCMETGQTVVLLNLQNLYESLYDALNQYYVTLGDQNYVDLGLGTHRVKCRVNKVFRLIVIEEKEVVYEQFPLPLINRLEKHYLDINTVLKPEQRDLVGQLQEWVGDFVSTNDQDFTTKKYNPKDVFIGCHSDTCSSVVLQVTESQEGKTDFQKTLNKAKSVLLKCATPESVVRLDKSRLLDEERDHLMNEYVTSDLHSSLGDYMICDMEQLEQSFLFTEVTTFSRLLTAADTQLLQDVTKLEVIKLLSLHQFDTQHSFLKKIREFLSSTTGDKALIIQTEHDELNGKTLSSAKYCCVNEITQCGNLNNTRTFVYFLTKLSRIEGGTSYNGFQGGLWRSVHLDDLRRSKELVIGIHSLKNMPMSDLFRDPPEAMETENLTGAVPTDYFAGYEDVFNTTDFLSSCVQSAVNMLRDEGDNGELTTRRVQNVLTLLNEGEPQGEFVKVVRKRLHMLLEDHESNIQRPESWVFREAFNVSGLQEGGTFMHTLWRKIQAVVTPLFANLISVIDRDSNLDLLLDGGEGIRNLWLEIFRNMGMLDVPYVQMENKVLMVQNHITKGSTMRCVMPFSWWIKDFLDELLVQTSRHKASHFKELFVNTPLGSYLAKTESKKMKTEFFERYLQDFVSMTMNVTTDEERLILCQALTSCVDEVAKQQNDDYVCLLHIHVAHRNFQGRLQNLSRMIALQPKVVAPLLDNQHVRQCSEMVLDVHAAKACVECLDHPDLETDALCLDWLNQVKKLQASLELICSQQNSEFYGERCRERLSDVRNDWNRIYILSLYVERMLLGFQQDDIQLRAVVLNCTKTLSSLLEKNSDVKSPGAFKAVTELLKTCKQETVCQIFRFGLECGVCMGESQEPVALPCDHIYCLTCIKNHLHYGQKLCPKCKQLLPDNFQPCVSKTMKASCDKNVNIKRRCIGFFIDLLSSVCFKDNAPPTDGVISHLLSFLMIDTGDKVFTKDLSPFDELPDKNPVVRSVVLKLLLKFSFDEVQKFLQQHLKTVEDSQFLDGNKAELYALYINCLEDSLWEKMPQEGNRAKELKFFSDGKQFLSFCLDNLTAVPATVSIQHLQHIARLRLTLTKAALLISDRLSGNERDEATDFLKMVMKLCQDSGNDWYRIYLIRKLSELRGVEQVQVLLKHSELSWIFPDGILQQSKDCGQMDQYLVFGESYKAVRDAVAKALVNGSVEQIEEICKRENMGSPRKQTVFLLLALFREVTSLYRSPNKGLHPTTELCQALEDLIQSSKILHQVKNCATALVHNNLGPLATVPESTIIELVIHLKAVLLTDTHPLLVPLRQLGLFPEKMKTAFIPTMPDDMLAVAQAAIKQDDGFLTWYVCSNNHPYAIGECGRPWVKGRCLECGVEIGGERHIPVSGSKSVNRQQDSTRRGHILGNPEQRDNPATPDTKTMSLTPFTLVRLLTHLAMLLGASTNPQDVEQIVHPPVENINLFLGQHITKDLDQLSKALGKGTDDTVTFVHLVLKTLQELQLGSHTNIDPNLETKESRNRWEVSMATDVMTPVLKDLERLLQEAKSFIRDDSRVSSNFIMRATFGDDCSFLESLNQVSKVHSSAVWSCRERFSTLGLMHIIEHNDQKKDLPVLWRFLQKEREFCRIKLLPEILILQKHLVKKYQNVPEQITGSIREFIEKQRERRAWYEKHIKIFLETWNLLRASVTSTEMKIPEEFCSEDLNMNSPLQYILPRRQGPGLCATALVNYLVTLHNELVGAVDTHTGEDSSHYRVTMGELMEQHVISFEIDKDLLPLVLSNCQYSLERGHEVISQYDLPRIQQQIITRFLQGKPLITRTGIPTLINTQEREYETLFKTLAGNVPQHHMSPHTRSAVSGELDSFSDVCEALRIVELLLGFLSVTGGDPTLPLVSYLCDKLKMAQSIDHHILQALGKCSLTHCVSLWQLISALKSKKMLLLKMEPFLEYPADYQEPLTEEDKTELKRFLSRGNVDQWLLEMHEFLLLCLGRQRATEEYPPRWSVKEAVIGYMDRKDVEVPSYIEENFPENLLLSHVVDTWKYSVIAQQEIMMNR